VSNTNKTNKGRKSSTTNTKGKSDSNTSNRGLASADQKTRKRVAREGGKASHSGGKSSSKSKK
jgi:hypothetical protein